MTFTVYWAGDLFDHKDLTGNLLLAAAVERLAHGRFHINLPQECESNLNRSTDIRASDYESLIESDLILANFDGHDLDSGTVAEFCFAKALGIPAVLFRSDFRFSGDRTTCHDPWNLMLSHFPRTESLSVHGMVELHKFHGPDTLVQYHDFLAEKILAALEKSLLAEPVLFPRNITAHDLAEHYKRILRSLGRSVEERFSEERLNVLVERKLEYALF